LGACLSELADECTRVINDQKDFSSGREERSRFVPEPVKAAIGNGVDAKVDASCTVSLRKDALVPARSGGVAACKRLWAQEQLGPLKAAITVQAHRAVIDLQPAPSSETHVPLQFAHSAVKSAADMLASNVALYMFAGAGKDAPGVEGARDRGWLRVSSRHNAARAGELLLHGRCRLVPRTFVAHRAVRQSGEPFAAVSRYDGALG